MTGWAAAADGDSFPLRPLSGIAALAMGALALASLDPSVDLRRYAGGLPAWLAGPVAAAAGIVALAFLHRRFSFRIRHPAATGRSALVATLLAAPFMVAVSLADLASSSPLGVNVPLPAALIFYPAIGFLAQLSLHVVPFAVLLWLLSAFGGRIGAVRLWSAVAAASALEAVLQSMAFGMAQPFEQRTFLAVHVLLFGIIELYLFRRYDLMAMYLFRLTYYGYWHILWDLLNR